MYLGRWQETDVAIKVLIEMQHFASNSEVQPQDAANLKPGFDSICFAESEQLSFVIIAGIPGQMARDRCGCQGADRDAAFGVKQ